MLWASAGLICLVYRAFRFVMVIAWCIGDTLSSDSLVGALGNLCFVSVIWWLVLWAICRWSYIGRGPEVVTRSREEMDDIQFVTAKMNVHLESQGFIIRHLFVPDECTETQGSRKKERKGTRRWEGSSSAIPSACLSVCRHFLSLLGLSLASSNSVPKPSPYRVVSYHRKPRKQLTIT